MSTNTLGLKKFLIGLLEDNNAWNEFSQSLESARKALAAFKAGITAEQTAAIVYVVHQLRMRFSEVHYDLVNAMITGEILLFASPYKEPAYILAGGGVIKDGPKYAQWDPPYRYDFTVGSYLLHALAGSAA